MTPCADLVRSIGEVAPIAKEDVKLGFFEAHHASGVQDSAGKDPRLAMIRDIGFKQYSIYSFEDCLVRFRTQDNVFLVHIIIDVTKTDVVSDADE